MLEHGYLRLNICIGKYVLDVQIGSESCKDGFIDQFYNIM